MNIINSLMKEHQLIIRMVHLLEHEAAKIKNKNIINTQFIKNTVDFLRTYADKRHHGKEEDILFRELSKKQISNDHKKEMQRFINEHKIARNYVKKLESITNSHCAIDLLEKLINLYKNHIKNENLFFSSILKYFPENKHLIMLNKADKFDQQFDQEKYPAMIENMEQKNKLN